jgi:hypothetical protein
MVLRSIYKKRALLLAVLPGPRILPGSFDLEIPLFKAFPFEEGCIVVFIDNGWVGDTTEGPAFGESRRFSAPSFEEALSR